MRKLSIPSLAAIALLFALTATPAAARPRGVNGQIAFGRDDPLLEHVLYTINPDGSHEHQLLPFGLGSPVGWWSSDGSSIVTDGTATGDAALIVDPDTGTYRSLANPDPATFDFFACGVPSPDFDRLACAGGSEKDRSVGGIYTVRTSDGGDLRRLTSNTIEDEIGDYSPDGKRLVYSHIAPGLPDGPPDFARSGLYVLKVNGTGTRKIAPCCSSGGSWSPQDNQIVFSWSPPGFQVHSTLWVVHSDGSGLRQLPIAQAFCGGRTADSDTRGCVNPAWSPDGRKIVFRRTTPGFGEGGDLYTINADGTGLFQVARDNVEGLDWGPHALASG
jgi:Tol biopolymer transport system component